MNITDADTQCGLQSIGKEIKMKKMKELILKKAEEICKEIKKKETQEGKVSAAYIDSVLVNENEGIGAFVVETKYVGSCRREAHIYIAYQKNNGCIVVKSTNGWNSIATEMYEYRDKILVCLEEIGEEIEENKSKISLRFSEFVFEELSYSSQRYCFINKEGD